MDSYKLNPPEIFVVCAKAKAQGITHGVRIDDLTNENFVLSEIDKMLKSSPAYVCDDEEEELDTSSELFDIETRENIPNCIETLDDIIEYASLYEEHGNMAGAFVEHTGGLPTTKYQIDDVVVHWGTLREYGKELGEEMIGWSDIPKDMHPYIDIEKWIDDCVYPYYTEVDFGNSTFVLRDNY